MCELIWIIILTQLWEFATKSICTRWKYSNRPTDARFRSKTTFDWGKGDWGSSRCFINYWFCLGVILNTNFPGTSDCEFFETRRFLRLEWEFEANPYRFSVGVQNCWKLSVSARNGFSLPWRWDSSMSRSDLHEKRLHLYRVENSRKFWNFITEYLVSQGTKFYLSWGYYTCLSFP